MKHLNRRGERGAFDLSTAISGLVLLLIIFALWNVGPMYVQHFQFVDEVEKVARSYPRTAEGNKQTKTHIWKVAVELGINEYLYESDIEVSIAGTDRIVTYWYERECAVLPGWDRVFTFDDEIRQPLL